MERVIKLNNVKPLWVKIALIFIVPFILVSGYQLIRSISYGDYSKLWAIGNIIGALAMVFSLNLLAKLHVTFLKDHIEYYVGLNRKGKILVSDIVKIEVDFNSVSLHLKSGKLVKVDLNAAKDEPLKEIKEEFLKLKQKIENAES